MSNEKEDYYNKTRNLCWDSAINAFGVQYIYSKRSKWLNKCVAWVKVTGFVLPVLLGGLVSTYYQDKEVMEIALAIASPIAILQLVLSAILTVQNVESNLTKNISLANKNLLLSTDFKELASFPPSAYEDLKAKHAVLAERERNLVAEDVDLTDKEKREGLRYGLRQFQRPCVHCKVVPASMSPSDCPVCGNF